ncbi:MAG: EamA family transporter [Streptomyces sp.]|nr:EamA family transporter [Streptomyces sp.]
MRGSVVRSSGLGLAVLSACAFGGSGVAAKPLIDLGLDPLQVVWMRVAGAALVLLPVALRSRALPRRRPGLVAGFGLLAIVGCQALYFVAIARIPVGVAILVEFLGPALLLGWIRLVQRRPVTRAAAVGVVLATAGMTCVVEIWSGLAFDALGLLYAFGAACCQVAYFVLADHGTDGADAPEPVSVIAHGLLVGALALTVVAHPWTMRWSVLGHQAALGDREVPAVLLVGWIALVSTVVAYLTGVIAVRTLSPQVAAVVGALEAVVATVLAWVLLDEHLGPVQVAGGALVLAGALVAQTASSAGAVASPAASPAAPEPVPPAPAATSELTS